ncbi:MAG: beta-ketoacyl-[acyl-carrier-protein] synthase II, partial [Armatimonadota bacterium]|nr:beta-ketoacyl-[acyl-carrier-protein] synthase II [Armatimonadota bacterium]
MTTSTPQTPVSPFPQRVVVTGMGVIGPMGLDVPTAWSNVSAGRSGIGRITLFPTEGLRVQIAGQAWGFEPTNYMSAKDARRADRFVQFAIAAAQEALAQSRLTVTDEIANDVGVIIGCGAGGSTTYIKQQHIMDTLGPDRISPLLIPMIIVDSASTQVSIMTGARGPSYGVASACATAADAIGQAFETIRRGDAQVMITGGSEASCNMLGIPGFDQ